MVEIMPSGGAAQFAVWRREMERRLGALETARSGDHADWQTHIETFEENPGVISPFPTNVEPIIEVTITPPTWSTTALVIANGILVAATDVGTGGTIPLSISDAPWVTTGPQSWMSVDDGDVHTVSCSRSLIVSSAGLPFSFSLDSGATFDPLPPLSAVFSGVVIHRR